MPKLPMGDIGPCEFVWDYGGTGLKLSPFLGKVELSMKDSIQKVYEEGMGDAAVDAVYSGSVLELTVPMTRSTLAQLQAVRPGSTIAGSVKTLINKAGTDMYVNAKAVVIKPMRDGVVSTVHSEWIELFKVHPYREFAIGFERSGQRVFSIKFLVFPSQDSGHWGEFGTIGVTP